MKRYSLLFFLAFLYNGVALAICGTHQLADPANVKLKGESLMLVVHASSTYDARFSTKRGLDEAVRFAKGKGLPIVYLQDDTPEQFYFMEDCEPTYWVPSQGGEVRFEVQASHLYVVGGHLELCMSTALHDILYQWARKPPRNLTITYFMDAVYSNGKSVDQSAPYYRDFDRFMGIVTYGRPGGEHWPKLSLLETMGVILRQEDDIEYLKQILPRWDTTFSSDYQVEMQVNNSNSIVLRSAKNWGAPTLRFQFIDSAVNLTARILE